MNCWSDTLAASMGEIESVRKYERKNLGLAVAAKYQKEKGRRKMGHSIVAPTIVLSLFF